MWVVANRNAWRIKLHLLQCRLLCAEQPPFQVICRVAQQEYMFYLTC